MARLKAEASIDGVAQPRDIGMGHQMYCAGSNCRRFRYQEITLVGNGSPTLIMRCKSCRNESRFKFVVGGWMPESLIGTMDLFVSAKIDEQRAALAEPPTEEPMLMHSGTGTSWKRPPPLLSQPTPSTRMERFKSWMTCSRYLRFVALPASAPLTFLGTLGALAYNRIYVHPIYEWMAPMWQPWMNSAWLTLGPLLATAVLLAGYVRCRLDHRVSREPEPIRFDEHVSEHDLMMEIESL